eukprot:3379389-Lingulodinium_polyedra.AAC.1
MPFSRTRACASTVQEEWGPTGGRPKTPPHAASLNQRKAHAGGGPERPPQQGRSALHEPP